MKLRWYTRRDETGVEKGPFEKAAIVRAVKKASLSRDTLVRREDEEGWSPLEGHPAFRAIDRDAGPRAGGYDDAAVTLPARRDGGDAGVVHDCGRCGLVHAEDASCPGLASLATRLGAQVVDSVTSIALLVVTIPLWAVHEGFVWLGTALLLAYHLLADGMNGQSLGKRVFNIAVVDETTGRRCGPGKSILRNATHLLGWMDWIWIFGERRRRAGDHLASTRVISLSRWGMS